MTAWLACGQRDMLLASTARQFSLLLNPHTPLHSLQSYLEWYNTFLCHVRVVWRMVVVLPGSAVGVALWIVSLGSWLLTRWRLFSAWAFCWERKKVKQLHMLMCTCSSQEWVGGITHFGSICSFFFFFLVQNVNFGTQILAWRVFIDGFYTGIFMTLFTVFDFHKLSRKPTANQSRCCPPAACEDWNAVSRCGSWECMWGLRKFSYSSIWSLLIGFKGTVGRNSQRAEYANGTIVCTYDSDQSSFSYNLQQVWWWWTYIMHRH